MKKMISIILVVVLCLCFAACGGNEGGDTQQNENSTAETVVSTNLNRSMYDEINGCYTNSYTQLSVTPPGDWYLYSDNDLAMAYLGGRVTGDEFAMWGTSDFKNKTVIPDFAFQDMANSNNFSVVYVNLAKIENGEHPADEDTVRALIIESLTGQGKLLQQREEAAAIGGQEFRVLEFGGEDANRYFATKQQGDYVIVITATDRSGIGEDVFFGFVN